MSPILATSQLGDKSSEVTPPRHSLRFDPRHLLAWKALYNEVVIEDLKNRVQEP